MQETNTIVLRHRIFHHFFLKKNANRDIWKNNPGPEKSRLFEISGCPGYLPGIGILAALRHRHAAIHRASGKYEKQNNHHPGDKENVIGRQANLSRWYALAEESLLDMAARALKGMYKPGFHSIGLKSVQPWVREKGHDLQNHRERGLLNDETTPYYFLNDPANLVVEEE